VIVLEGEMAAQNFQIFIDRSYARRTRRRSAVAQRLSEHATLTRAIAKFAVWPFAIKYAAPIHAVRPFPLSQNTSTFVSGGKDSNRIMNSRTCSSEGAAPSSIGMEWIDQPAAGADCLS
jgi:hypothetical protein